MIIKQIKRQSYVVVDRLTAQDDTLTWKARGLLLYLLSLPDNWVVREKELASHSPEGLSALRSGLKELELEGYIFREMGRDEDGKYVEPIFTVYERPLSALDRSNPESRKKTRTTPEMERKSPQSEHHAMVEAVAELTKMDMKIRGNAGRIAKIVKELRGAGYTMAHIEAFKKIWQKDWRYKKDGQPPSLRIIMQELGKAKVFDNRPSTDEARDNALRILEEAENVVQT